MEAIKRRHECFWREELAAGKVMGWFEMRCFLLFFGYLVQHLTWCSRWRRGISQTSFCLSKNTFKIADWLKWEWNEDRTALTLVTHWLNNILLLNENQPSWKPETLDNYYLMLFTSCVSNLTITPSCGGCFQSPAEATWGDPRTRGLAGARWPWCDFTNISAVQLLPFLTRRSKPCSAQFISQADHKHWDYNFKNVGCIIVSEQKFLFFTNLLLKKKHHKTINCKSFSSSCSFTSWAIKDWKGPKTTLNLLAALCGPAMCRCCWISHNCVVNFIPRSLLCFCALSIVSFDTMQVF